MNVEFLFKKINDNDILDMYNWRLHSDVSSFLNKPSSYEEHLSWWNNEIPTGIVIFSNIDRQNYKLELGGYAIPIKNGYRSYYANSIEAIKHYIFSEMNFNKIYMTIPKFNTPSLMVNLKCGFEVESVLKDWFCFNGSFYDDYLLSVSKTSWLNSKKEIFKYKFINE